MKLRTRPRNYKVVEDIIEPIPIPIITIENTPSDPDFEVLLPMALIAV